MPIFKNAVALPWRLCIVLLLRLQIASFQSVVIRHKDARCFIPLCFPPTITKKDKMRPAAFSEKGEHMSVEWLDMDDKVEE